MNIRCPSCQTTFRVDPARIPPAGVRARCARCGATFPVTAQSGDSGSLATSAASAPSSAPAAAPAGLPSTPAGRGTVASTVAAAANAVASTVASMAGSVASAAQTTAPTAADLGASNAGGVAEAAAPAAMPSHTAPSPAAPPMSPPAAEAAGGMMPSQVPPAPQSDAPKPATFGTRDPNARAHRIARALVSDIVAYHKKKRTESLTNGTLRTDFREEIMKSWEEYVAQVGQDLAKSTPFFRNALNDILADGQNIF